MAEEVSYASQNKRKSLLAQLKHVAIEAQQGLHEQAEQALDAYVVGFKKNKVHKESKNTKLI